MLLANDWKEYELIDTCGGEKLERFGEITVIRPDPQIIWQTQKKHPGWRDAHMHYHRSSRGGGSWEIRRPVPERWTVSYRNLSFHIKPTDFKHMGLFPEQAVNWQWIADKIKNAEAELGRPVRVLNLFAYTGGATVAAAAAGAAVCHMDAAKAMNQWAKDNLSLSGLSDAPVRFITDDAMKFAAREQRRESFYDAIIMDPPSYGRGPGGEVWKLEDQLYNLIGMCAALLSDTPVFFLVNSYTAGLSPMVVQNIMQAQIRYKGRFSSGEIALPATAGLPLPCGIYGRYEGL